MPFTLVHPIAVLPLKRARPRWFSLTGLVIGSMGPDFEYFLRWAAHSTVAHSVTISHGLPALLFFNLPMVLLLSFLLHDLVKQPLLRHLPWALPRTSCGTLSPTTGAPWSSYGQLWHSG